MALSRDQKEAQLAVLTEKMQSAASVMFIHFMGLSVAQVSDFRAKLRKQNAEMRVAKKTLVKLAGKQAGLPDFPDSVLDGPVACVFSFADPLTGAQTTLAFSKNNEQVALVGGVFDGQVLTKEQSQEFAKMPGRQVLLARFAGMLKGPLNSFAGICRSPLAGFARGLQQLAERGGVPSAAQAPSAS